MTRFYKIFVIILVFSTVAYTGAVIRIVEFANNFNEYVVVFLPKELLVVISLIVLAVLFKLYKVVTE